MSDSYEDEDLIHRMTLYSLDPLDTESTDRAYIDGRNAFREGTGGNPYPSNTPESDAWQGGWIDAEDEYLDI